jgi:hypothetical protein
MFRSRAASVKFADVTKAQPVHDDTLSVERPSAGHPTAPRVVESSGSERQPASRQRRTSPNSVDGLGSWLPGSRDMLTNIAPTGRDGIMRSASVLNTCAPWKSRKSRWDALLGTGGSSRTTTLVSRLRRRDLRSGPELLRWATVCSSRSVTSGQAPGDGRGCRPCRQALQVRGGASGRYRAASQGNGVTGAPDDRTAGPPQAPSGRRWERVEPGRSLLGRTRPGGVRWLTAPVGAVPPLARGSAIRAAMTRGAVEALLLQVVRRCWAQRGRGTGGRTRGPRPVLLDAAGYLPTLRSLGVGVPV